MKSLINTAFLKEQLKRSWAISGLVLLFLVLFIILPLFQMFDTPYEKANFIVRLLSAQDMFMNFMCVFIPLCLVFEIFSYLFQTKSTTAVHSLPISKKQLFCTNILTGFILIIIPLIIFSGLILINQVAYLEPEVLNISGEIHYGRSIGLPAELFSGGLAAGEVINSFPVVLGFFLRTLMTFIFYFAVFVFAVTVSGNSLICILVSIFVPLLPLGLLMLFQAAGFLYCFGFQMYGFTNLLQDVSVLSNPVALGLLFNTDAVGLASGSIQSTGLSPYIITHIVVTLILFALSAWCYHVRKQERAGDSIVFVPVKNVLIFLISLAGTLFLGIFFLLIFGNIWAMYSGFALGFVITYIIAQMLAEKTFNIFGKIKLLPNFAGVLVGLFLITIVVTTTDIIGYSNYSPKVDDVEGVYLHWPNKFYNEDNADDYFITNPEIIAEAIKVQKEIINNKDSLREVFINSLNRNYYPNYYETQRCNFTFKLKNGSLVAREYKLPYSFIKSSGLNDLLNTDEVILSEYPFLANLIKTDKTSNLSIYYYNPDKRQNSEAIFIKDTDQISFLSEEIKKDIIATARLEKDYLEEIVNNKADPTAYRDVPFVNVQFEVRDTMNSSRYIYTLESCRLTSYENTMEWLKENGFSFKDISD